MGEDDRVARDAEIACELPRRQLPRASRQAAMPDQLPEPMVNLAADRLLARRGGRDRWQGRVGISIDMGGHSAPRVEKG